MSPRKKVLVVDDEENLCLLYRDELESEGYLVQTVTDPAEAVRIVESDPPDVVVLDIRMPRMDGIETMGKILCRRNELPVILNSAYSSYKDDFRSWPADAYVTKSSDTGELKRTIRKVLGKAAAVTVGV